MRWALLAVLLLPMAQADVGVEMLFHGERPVPALHPDGQRQDPPAWTAAGGCPLGGPVTYSAVWSVAPPDDRGDIVRYGHGDYSFGHSFNITSDAELLLPVSTDGAPPVGPLRLEAGLWRGDYRLPWDVKGDEELLASVDTEVMLQNVPRMDDNGTTVYLIEAVLAIAGLRIDVMDGVALTLQLSPAAPCDPLMEGLRMHASDAAWPALSFTITDHVDVRGSTLQFHDDGLRGWVEIQHWRGPAAIPDQALRFAVGDQVAFETSAWQKSDAYHHGIAPLGIYLPSLPLDEGNHALQVTISEDGDSWAATVMTWTVHDGVLVTQCVREPVDRSARSEGHRDVCTHEPGKEVPAWLWSVLLALLAVALRRRER